tara:strand:+ start:401 stop:1009 length:609 start_codon:yes stop_codon:yes gene_type:complete
MEKFSTLKSIPVHMPLSNIDTDMIIPKQFLKTIKRTGLGVNLFYEMRYDEKDNLIKDFVINRKPFSNSKILLAGKNFGCGSSREHAPWALLDFGIKCVISSSFADIFYSNCFKNGILPIVLDEKTIQELAEYSRRESEIEIKIETQEVLYGNKSAKFDLDSFKKKCLIEGIDDIGLSLEKAKNILDYENKIKNEKPWLNNND